MEKGERCLAMLPLTNTKASMNGLCQQNVCRSISVIVHTQQAPWVVQTSPWVMIVHTSTCTSATVVSSLAVVLCCEGSSLSRSLALSLSLCDLCVYMVIVL